MDVISWRRRFHDDLHKPFLRKWSSSSCARLLQFGMKPPQLLSLPLENSTNLFDGRLPHRLPVVELPVSQVRRNTLIIHRWAGGCDSLMASALRQSVAVLTDAFHSHLLACNVLYISYQTNIWSNNHIMNSVSSVVKITTM